MAAAALVAWAVPAGALVAGMALVGTASLAGTDRIKLELLLKSEPGGRLLRDCKRTLVTVWGVGVTASAGSLPNNPKDPLAMPQRSRSRANDRWFKYRIFPP